MALLPVSDSDTTGLTGKIACPVLIRSGRQTGILFAPFALLVLFPLLNCIAAT
jgi:hypothetical protein